MRIGLLGGSFNPPHDGHVHISEMALARLDLHQVWWLVTPGNPLKDHAGLPGLRERLALCRALATHPGIRCTGLEAAFNVRYTADTLDILTRRRPAARFVWLMGADNLADFHRWERWRDIAATVPIAVFDRPGSTLAFHSAKAAHALARFRIDEADAPLLATRQPPAWTFIHGARSALSSTALRGG